MKGRVFRAKRNKRQYSKDSAHLSGYVDDGKAPVGVKDLSQPVVVLVEGDPACVHRELIVDGVGTCRYCGRVKDYRTRPKKSRRQRECNLSKVFPSQKEG